MNGAGRRWTPAALLALGILLTRSVNTQQRLPLRRPLAEVVPQTLDGFAGQDVALSDDARRVAGVTTYLARTYGAIPGDQTRGFTLY
ncbi:MAG TPA: hypothetical protein VN848_03620, partial [Gemmatimonadales bacterium]|nr:hypothetical protein [Gemmatimonadales bacterium]